MTWLHRILWIGGMLVVFVAGIVVGGAGTLRLVQQRYEERMNPENWEPRTMTWLSQELELTPQQHEQVRPAVRQAVADLSAFSDRADEDRRAILGRMLVQVSQQLTPTQQDRLREMIQQSQAKQKTTGR
jgi:hypothetical protein